MFDLELNKAVQEVKTRGAKKILVQLPEGLKTKVPEVVKVLEKETGAEVIIWYGSCFGACDLPLGLDVIGIDLMLQWGHNRFHKKEW